jgi:crossover junction endodeoxyribonuclease RuvC
MKVISLDPGYERLGIAVIEKNPREKEKLLYSDCFQTSAKDPFPIRLQQIGLEIKKVIETYHPESLAFETLFFNTNQKTAMHVAEVRGVIIYEAMLHNIPVFEYTPPQIKAAVAGDGRADKKQVWSMVLRLLKIEKKIKYDDEYDAIAAGLTHIACFRPAKS